MNSIPWWGYVILAGLSWGTYVPIIFFGGQMLSPADPKSIGGRLASILCVGVAYFVLAVVIPVALMATRGEEAKPEWKTTGLVFSGLAGVMGAVGAICVIFASKAATDTARADFTERVNELTARVEAASEAERPDRRAELDEFKAGQKQYLASYRVFIAPLIFTLAPLINTLLSLVWHPDPKTGDWASFHFEMPGWKLVVGIVLVATGTFLVLMSKEDLEKKKGAPPPPATTPAPKPAEATGS